MNKAKAAVQDFLHKDGKHETTVHETVNPAIQHENVTRTQHENAQTVVDREVHQDHHHTSVQPIQHREVLPEQHSHNMVGVEHREIKHGNGDHVRQKLDAERAQFKDHRTVGETQHTQSEVPVVAGEHVHHHVHETIQPIVQKETVQPSVVHTTVPIHEVHHNEAKHHTASALPAITMDQFKHQHGTLNGREERTDAFQGEPRKVGSTLGDGANGGILGGEGARGTTSLTEGAGHHHHHNHDGARAGEGLGSGNGVNSGLTGSNSTATGTHSGNHTISNQTGVGHNNATTGVGHTGTGVNDSTTSATGKKPGLLDRLNPMKDADGDGKKGLMD